MSLYVCIRPLNTCRPDSQIYFTKHTKISICYDGTNKLVSVTQVVKELFGPIQIFPQYMNFRLEIVQIFQTSDQHHFNINYVDDNRHFCVLHVRRAWRPAPSLSSFNISVLRNLLRMDVAKPIFKQTFHKAFILLRKSGTSLLQENLYFQKHSICFDNY